MKRDSRYDILFEPIAIGSVEVRPLLLGSALLGCAPSAGFGKIGPVNSERFQTPTRALPATVARLRGVAVVA